jgi:endonuclease YncB( thermonuclease family)
MYRVASFPSQRLARTCLRAGAFFFALLLPLMADAVTGPEGGQPAIITGTGRVVDGDTLDVGPTRVRLEGIDAPEIAQTCQTAKGESWDCGVAAAAMLRKLAEHKDLACDRTGTDRYRRVLATCYGDDGIDIDEAMVRVGLARAFVRYSVAYVGVEAEARKRKIGVWQGPAEAPWDFRHNEWQVAEVTAPKGCAIKGNVSAHGRIYHMPWSPWYDKVRMDEGKGKRWFCSEAEALAAGWRPASPN